jgi:tripartite-type tricarboxylate transporter receptor subunit TctC
LALSYLELELWAGLLAPAATPPAIVRKLNEAVVEAVASDDIRQKMRNLELTPVGGTSSDYGDRLRREIVMWADVVRKGGIEIQR